MGRGNGILAPKERKKVGKKEGVEEKERSNIIMMGA